MEIKNFGAFFAAHVWQAGSLAVANWLDADQGGEGVAPVSLGWIWVPADGAHAGSNQVYLFLKWVEIEIVCEREREREKCFYLGPDSRGEDCWFHF